MPLIRLPTSVWIRRLLWAAGGLLGLCVLAWLVLPPLLKSQLEVRGSEALGRTVSVGAVDFKPWTLELTLSDIRVASADGRTSQLRIQRIYADAAIQSLWRLAPVVDAIRVEQPQLTLTHRGDGHYDMDDVLQRLHSEPQAPATARAAPLRFALHNLVLSDGAVAFTDTVGGVARQHQLRQLNLSLPFLSNFDSQREVTVQPRLAFVLNGSAFDSAAQATPFATDAQGEVSLQITHLDMAPYLPYLPASLPLRLQAAVLDGSLKLAFSQAPQRTLRLSGALTVSGLALQDPAGAPLLSVASVQAVVAELRPLDQVLHLASLQVTAPHLALRRNRAGAWNVAPSTSTAPAATSAAPAWQLALDQLRLTDGQVQLQDDSLAPALRLAVDNTTLELHGAQWPFARAAQFKASASVHGAGAGNAAPSQAARIQLQGEGSDVAGTLSAQLQGLDLGLVAPYLAQYLVPRGSGVLEGELAANWQNGALRLQAPRLALHDFALSAPAGNAEIRGRDMPSFKLLELRQVDVDMPRRALSVGQLLLQKPSVRVARAEDGQWMFARWLVPAAARPADPAAATATPAKPPVPWSLSLAEARLDDGRLLWVDRQPSQPVLLEFTALQTRANGLTLDGKKPSPLSLSAQVRTARSEPGSLRFDGSLMWDPLRAQGTLDARQFPAQALAPYGLAHLRLDLQRADTSFKGQLRYASLPGGPELQLQGDGAVEELRLNSALTSASGEAQTDELLTWKALSLPGIALSLSPTQPLRLSLREVSLSDFFARLIVNAQGRLVLQDLARPDEPAQGAGAAAPAQATASAAAAVPVPASAVASGNDPVIEVGTIRLVGGHVAFSDRFIKPNYSADLSELSGSLSHFGSQKSQGAVQLAELELHGRAEGTASLDISGRVNPLARPLALDLNAKVRDLELSPLSSYAIKYAGYGIERGRMSVDLHYTVNPDGQLQAGNKIILNQLVFGEPVPGGASLPVKLAAALLADSHGVIDLDLPLSGSLNDPQFHVWPLVWQVVGNLLTKALLSPFSLISGLVGADGGGSDEASSVAFESGSARISPAALPGLDTLARALRDKGSLHLTLEGTACLEREQEAMQRERLNALLLAEKRRQAASAGQDVTAVGTVTPDEYPALLKALYQRADLKKPRNLIGLSKDLPGAEMEALLLASVRVDEDAVRQLALNRSLAVREYLGAHQVPSERVFLGVLKTASPTSTDWQPRVEMSIEHR